MPLTCETTFLIGMGLLSNYPACCGQLVKILITLEPYGILGLNFAYFFILILSSLLGMQNAGDGLLSIYFAGQCILVKMFESNFP